ALRESVRPQARVSPGKGHRRHASQGTPGPQDLQAAESVRRARASARGAETCQARDFLRNEEKTLVKNLTVATGKRKTSIARVFLRDGAGNVSINGKTVEEYFAGLP